MSRKQDPSRLGFSQVEKLDAPLVIKHINTLANQSHATLFQEVRGEKDGAAKVSAIMEGLQEMRQLAVLLSEHTPDSFEHAGMLSRTKIATALSAIQDHTSGQHRQEVDELTAQLGMPTLKTWQERQIDERNDRIDYSIDISRGGGVPSGRRR